MRITLLTWAWAWAGPAVAASPPPTPWALPASAAPASPTPDPIVLVTPFVAGSGPDLVARTIATHWALMAGEPVEVINMPENQGRTAARWVAASATDGRLMLLTSARMLDAGPLVPHGQRLRPVSAPPIPLQRFQLVARVGELPFMTVFPRGMSPSPLRRREPLQDALAASDAAPGSAGPGPISARTTMAGQYAPSGRAGPSGPSPQAVFPPLLNQPGAFPRTDWNGLLVSARMDKAQVDELRARFGTLLALPEVRWAIAQAGSDLWEEMPAEEAVEMTPLAR